MASNLRVDSIVPATGSSVSIGTATGGVNIPGVLTYEDVTNVDSVGVITARSSINVNAASSGIGVTINSGGINVAGVITATSFSGIDSDKISEGNTEVETIDTGSDGHVKFSTEGGERLRIGPAGQIGIAGANYGTSGQVLTSQGSGSVVQWATPAGGITHARIYRLTTTVSASGSSQILTPWEYADDAASGHLGSGWSLPSSGVFSFPTTGIYDVSIMGMMNQQNDSNAWCGVQGQATVNNSSYDEVFEIYQQIVQASGSSTQYVNFYGHCMLDVTDTSNVKFKISFFSDGNEAVNLNGSSTNNLTALKITRLGDT